MLSIPSALQTRFERCLRNKAVQLLSADDVREYLTFLAVRRKVSSSTQNQAFNTLTCN